MRSLIRKRSTLASGLKLVGTLEADGLVEINGLVDADLRCASLMIGPSGHVTGTVNVDDIVVDGKVNGPIFAQDVVLKSHAHVIGDIICRFLAVEKGAQVDGRLVRSSTFNGTAECDLKALELASADATKLMPESEESTSKAELVVEARCLGRDRT
jgi:cytoskeletal protein CcmA (bactofilin family)